MTQRVLDILADDIPSKIWIRQHLDYQHDWHCLIWPFALATTGYAQITGNNYAVHRLMCEYRHGPPPSDEHHAAHSCDRGHEGCVNPCHVSWQTPSENHKARFAGRLPMPQNKITAEQADEVRAMKGRERLVDTAERFGISERNVRMIQNGHSWRKDKRTYRIFSEAEVKIIRDTPWQEKSAQDFALEFGVHRAAIDRIRTGKTYRYFLDEQQHRQPQPVSDPYKLGVTSAVKDSLTTADTTQEKT